MPGDRIPHSVLPTAEMGTAQQEISVSSTKVYVVMSFVAADDYGCGGDSWVCSVHRTEETAQLFCQARRLEQLEEQLNSVKAEPSYEPELRHRWWVREQPLKD